MAMPHAAFICSEELWQRGHGGAHPLKPERLQRTYELLNGYGAFEPSNSRLVLPSPATREELTLFHSAEYVEAVARLSRGEGYHQAWRYNFGPGDNPIFAGMTKRRGSRWCRACRRPADPGRRGAGRL